MIYYLLAGGCCLGLLGAGGCGWVLGCVVCVGWYWYWYWALVMVME